MSSRPLRSTTLSPTLPACEAKNEKNQIVIDGLLSSHSHTRRGASPVSKNRQRSDRSGQLADLFRKLSGASLLAAPGYHSAECLAIEARVGLSNRSARQVRDIANRG